MKRLLITTLLSCLVTCGSLQAAFSSAQAVDVLIRHLVEKQVITEDDAGDIRAEIEKIEKDLHAAEAEKQKKAPKPVTAKAPLRMSGYTHVRYQQSDEAGFNDGLDIRRARLTLSSEPAENMEYRVQLDFAGSRRALTGASFTAPATLNTQNGSFSRPTVLDAQIGYKLSSAVKVAVGQFKVPFGQENLTSGTALEAINRSQVTESLVPGRDIGSQGRDQGIMFSGRHLLGATNLDWQAGLFNGTGINSSDDNSRKDIALRTAFTGIAPKLTLAAAYYDGRSTSAHLKRNRLGLEAAWQWNDWTAKGEYIQAKDDATRREGYHLLAGKMLGERNQAVLRYDWLDPNTAASRDERSTWTLGWNHLFTADGAARFQLNYEKRKERQEVTNDLLLGQFQAGF